MLELVSKLKTSVVVVERATGELLRMIPRKEMKLLTIHLLRKPQSMEKLLLREKLEDDPKEGDETANNTSVEEAP